MMQPVSRWSTDRVLMELFTDGVTFHLRRTRGHKDRQLWVNFTVQDVSHLTEALRLALRTLPPFVLPTPEIVSEVPCCYGPLEIGWEQYWWGRGNALMIRQYRAVAVEAHDAAAFVTWLTRSLAAIAVHAC